MTGPISYDNDRHISGGGTSTDFDFHAGKVAIRLSPENAVGNDISKCVNICDTGTGKLYPVATATPPQKFSLPLADDWVRVNAAEYWKTQEGIVVVTFRVAKTNGAAISAGINHVATLPEGFRPVGYFPHAAVAIMKDNLVCAAWIDTNGWVMCNTSMDIPQSSGSEPALWAGFAGTFVFVAAS